MDEERRSSFLVQRRARRMYTQQTLQHTERPKTQTLVILDSFKYIRIGYTDRDSYTVITTSAVSVALLSFLIFSFISTIFLIFSQ